MTDTTVASLFRTFPGQMPYDRATFDVEALIARLKHYLPAQAPLKDFIHHNTLHALQDHRFDDALARASAIFGYQVHLTLEQYRAHHREGRIGNALLDRVVSERKGANALPLWRARMLDGVYPLDAPARVGRLRALWRSKRGVDLDARIQPLLFRVICSYLDQGISIWKFPVDPRGFLESLRTMERTSFVSIFRSPRARRLLLEGSADIGELLDLLVGDHRLFEHYLVDQQFAHPGWSGMVSTVEDAPSSLLDGRRISLRDLVMFELLLEIDALDAQHGEHWAALGKDAGSIEPDLFGRVERSEHDEVLSLWHEAYEWSYYDQVLCGLGRAPTSADVSRAAAHAPARVSFQALFCIDDRECSLRRYIERADPDCATFGTPGFFGVEFFYQPYAGKFLSKLCPAPVTPQHLIKEVATSATRASDPHFGKSSHGLLGGWLITQTLGFWSALRLFRNVFVPSSLPASSSSFRHMEVSARLAIESSHPSEMERGLRVGFTVDEMADRVEKLLNSIGLVRHFAPLVYVIGHGSTSVNNPHYAAYDCGACCGRPGSVNARVLCVMANHPGVRELLRQRGLQIPEHTQFIGGLHDTSRDEIVFYDEASLTLDNAVRHERNGETFRRALTDNAKERSRRFDSIDTRQDARRVHGRMKLRSVSLFEPRPELNHATNALCIVGRRELSKGLFLDRRAFMNSYDHRVDPRGEHLFGILKAAAPVCGGINLEYFFSRTDNNKLGAGTKLPHNVMGLIGVANGMDGDLRPGLPSQMIELHDPVRLLIVVEHFNEVVLDTIKRHEDTCEWFANEWVRLATVHPETREISVLREGRFVRYDSAARSLPVASDLHALVEANHDNIPVHLID
jgi:uncharacterized protein YbcC (UPF0753/DUF2309 family)